MPAQERWSRENPGISWGLCWTTVAGGGEGEKVVDFPIFLSHIQYDLPSRFTHPQGLARITVKHKKNTIRKSNNKESVKH
jgi:hypothetical protein